MASEIHNGYAAEKYPLAFKYAKPVIDLVFLFYESDDTTELDFTDNTGSTFKIWEDDENGKLLLTVLKGNGLTISGNTITMNTSAGQMTIPRGRYYYEFSYYTAGGYEYLLMFGEAKIV
jgi:hypothetical protein